MPRKELTEFDEIKKSCDLVRGEAVNFGGDYYIVQYVNPYTNIVNVYFKSLAFPDKDQISMNVNKETLFVVEHLHDLDI